MNGKCLSTPKGEFMGRKVQRQRTDKEETLRRRLRDAANSYLNSFMDRQMANVNRETTNESSFLKNQSFLKETMYNEESGRLMRPEDGDTMTRGKKASNWASSNGNKYEQTLSSNLICNVGLKDLLKCDTTTLLKKTQNLPNHNGTNSNGT